MFGYRLRSYGRCRRKRDYYEKLDSDLGGGITHKVDSYVSLPQFVITAASIGEYIDPIKTHVYVGTIEGGGRGRYRTIGEEEGKWS